MPWFWGELAIEAGGGEAVRTYVKWADPHEGGWRAMRVHIIGRRQRWSCNVRSRMELKRGEGGRGLLFATHDCGPGFLEQTEVLSGMRLYGAGQRRHRL